MQATTVLLLILLRTVLLCAALWPLSRIVRDLPLEAESARNTWKVLTALGISFAVASPFIGYIEFQAVGSASGWSVVSVPALFFLGSVFVLTVSRLSLETVQVMHRVLAENITDPLMQIRNRRYLDRRLVEEFARAHRYGLPLSVLLIDVDHFKQINDKHGHAAGDLALARFGEILRGHVRESDIVARYGGEEVVVVATGTDAPGAFIFAERLRHKIEMQATRDAPKFTVSIGVATLDDTIANPAALVRQADEGLYAAKRSGRNRVGCHERQPVVPSALEEKCASLPPTRTSSGTISTARIFLR